MDWQSKRQILEKRGVRLAFRIGILFAFSALFKSFDLTFVADFGTQPVRSTVFSLVFITFGYWVWQLAIVLIGGIEHLTKRYSVGKRLVVLVLLLLIYGLSAAYLFGFTYAMTDILLFNRYEAWESFVGLSYELNIGIFLFYLLILAFNGIIFYYQQWNAYQVKMERLMRENIQARYEALMNQIEPHFFFNSLSVLTNLVHKNPDLSATFITRLAQCYRYILDKKMENLIPIEAEIEFLNSYTFLIKVRHQDSIIIDLDIPLHIQQNRMIPPASLQLLIENAIKHNRFSTRKPLHIDIRYVDEVLMVSNTLDRRLVENESTGTGLQNIRKRYELNGNGKVEITEQDGQFRVILPTFKRNEHLDF